MIYGDIISLGRHRLMCADSTSKEDLNKLIGDNNVDLLLTDPPYGIDIVKGGGEDGNNWRVKSSRIQQKGRVGITAGSGFQRERERESNDKPNGTVGIQGVVKARKYYPIIGDDKPFDPTHLLDLQVPSILFGANNYSSKLPDYSKWLVWYKKPKLNSKRNHFSDCELAWTNLKGKSVLCYHHTWSGMVRQGNRRDELKERIHPTQKPVGLLSEIIEEYTSPGDVVLDCYGGSGSTLIACEKTGRRCLMMELSEDYCDLIVKRYNDYVSGQSKLKFAS